MLRAEILKLKRSATWIIALILPLLAVITGTINLANNPDTLDAGWASFTSQVTLFYGLLFFSIGISLIASTVWRMEHRGTNWNLLLTTTRQPIKLVAAKIAVIAHPCYRDTDIGNFYLGLGRHDPVVLHTGWCDLRDRRPTSHCYPVTAVDANEIIRRACRDLPPRLRRGSRDSDKRGPPSSQFYLATSHQHTRTEFRLNSPSRFGRTHCPRCPSPPQHRTVHRCSHHWLDSNDDPQSETALTTTG